MGKENIYWSHIDVTVGSFDGTESCEHVGAYLLHCIKEKHGYNFGLYCDDGLGIAQASPDKQSKSRRIYATFLASMTLKSRLKPTKKS